jgi:hypothetical protein
MRFLVLVPANKESETGVLPNIEAMREMGKFNEELVKAGIMVSGEGLKATMHASRITYDGKKQTVRDGPFTESKELVAGFWILQAKSRAEIVEWMKKAPFDGGTTIEIREIFSPEDFAPVDPTGEMRAYEERLRELAAKRR